MSNQLIIRFPATGADQGFDNEPVSWFIVRSKKFKTGGQDTLSSLAETLAMHNVVISQVTALVPTESVLITQVTLPSTQSRYIQKALPFAVEEQLAQDVENVHLVAESKVSGNEVNVCVVDIDLMQSWTDALKAVNLSADVMLPDICAVPLGKADWTVLLTEDRAIMRTGPLAGLAVELMNLPVLMPLLVDEYSSDKKLPEGEDANATEAVAAAVPEEASGKQALSIEIMGEVGALDQNRDSVTQLENELSRNYDLQIDIQVIPDNWQLEMVRGLSSMPQPVNLLQGDFRAEGKRRKSASGEIWKPLAWVAGIFFCVYAGTSLYKTSFYESQAEEFRSQTIAKYKKLFPQDRRVRNVKKQMKAHLSKSGATSDAGFLALLGQAGTSLQSSGLKSSIIFQALKYDQRRDELTIDLHAKRSDQFERFKNALTQAGLSAEIGSVAEDKGVVKGRLRIKGASS